MPPPLVSVVITSYNRERYIATAIESVLAQSMTDFELIITDNASRDRTVDIARSYESDQRVRVHVNDSNIGQFPNRNLGAALARGKYLKYVDSDDAIYPHCLEVMAHMMERHPHAGMLLTAWSRNDPFYPFVLSPKEAYRRCFIHGERMSNSPLTCMFRRTLFNEIGGFDNERWPLSGDWDLILKLARTASVLFAPTGLCFYRTHGASLTSTADPVDNFTTEGLRISLEALRHPDCALPESEKQWATGKLLGSVVLYAANLALKKKMPAAALQLLKASFPALREAAGLFRQKQPQPDRTGVGNEPDWGDFPRAKHDRLRLGASTIRDDNGVSVVLCGDGRPEAWERTIRCALVQSDENYELVVVKTPRTNGIFDTLLARYPGLRLLEVSESNIWEARNIAAEECRGRFIKFIEPGALLYPYAIEFHAWPLKQNKAIDFVSWGQLGTAPDLLWLDMSSAAALELCLFFRVFSVGLASATVRKNSFLKLNGFDPSYGRLASARLFVSLSLEEGLIHGMLGQIANEGLEPFPDNYKISLLKKLGSILRENAAKNPLIKNRNIDEVPMALAESIKDRCIMKQKWNWYSYPWTRISEAIEASKDNDQIS
jgi:glycosyltransferase involved in cell wall biosynthesis